MLRTYCLLIGLIIFLSGPAQALTISFETGVFNSPENAYVEASIYVYGASLSQAYYGKPSPSRGVSTLMTIKSGDQFVVADKFNLLSPSDTSLVNFMDIKRYPLDPGEYEITCLFVDLADSTNTISETRKIKVAFDNSSPQFSTLHMLANVSASAPSPHLMKNGVYMEHLPFGFYHKNLNTLHFYSELYELDQFSTDKNFLTYQIISGDQRKKVVKKGHKLLKTADKIIPVLISFDISDLQSGNYYLELSLHKSDQSMLASQSVFFQRSNPEADAAEFKNVSSTDLDDSFVSNLTVEELRYGLKALAPIVPPADVEVLNILLQKEELKSMRFYLNRYWKSQSLSNPKAAYDAYMEVAVAIDRLFNNGFGYGFETDRGFIYLKYGKPNDMIPVQDEPSAPPYEIWVYNTIESLGQSHVKFLFYNPTLANGAYELLHSNAIGEVQNPRWEVELYGNSPNDVNGNDPVRSTQVVDNFGRKARRIFEEN